MAPAQPSPFILALPKAELHVHLEGSVEPETLVELSRRHDHPEFTLHDAERLYRYQDFGAFLAAFKTVSELVVDPEDYELITYRLMERLHAENVVHAEVYVSVGVALWYKRDFAPIFEALERGRRRGERDFGVSVLWLFDAVRQFGPDRARRVVDQAARYRERNVVGIGLGGDERRAGPELFRDVYAYAADHGLHLTCHAGETAGPESIWGALNLKAERLGHALTAERDRELMAALVERQVPLEICISSNLRTASCSRIEDHPVKRYFDLGAMVTLNSDDPAMFGTSLGREYQIAQEAFGFTDEQLREVARNSFEASFLAPEKKLSYLDRLDALPPFAERPVRHS
ncbi:MAG TPA: adenosine deaminase [Terriglobales bacterium]|nr:adenosine deaminase [Terriglobales bacterium]